MILYTRLVYMHTKLRFFQREPLSSDEERVVLPARFDIWTPCCRNRATCHVYRMGRCRPAIWQRASRGRALCRAQVLGVRTAQQNSKRASLFLCGRTRAVRFSFDCSEAIPSHTVLTASIGRPVTLTGPAWPTRSYLVLEQWGRVGWPSRRARWSDLPRMLSLSPVFR